MTFRLHFIDKRGDRRVLDITADNAEAIRDLAKTLGYRVLKIKCRK